MRTFTVEVRAGLADFPAGAKQVRLWVPLPSTGPAQDVTAVEIVAPVGHAEATEPEYGNRMTSFTWTDEIPERAEIVVRYTVRRREQHAVKRFLEWGEDALRKRALGPDTLVPITGTARELAASLPANVRASSTATARAIFQETLDELRYDKSGRGWGRGDFQRACSEKTGNCTDFHSYFIGIARAANVPALFEIGLIVPGPASGLSGKVPGYHCWGYFYDEQAGWTPVDISETWKLIHRGLGREGVGGQLSAGQLSGDRQHAGETTYFGFLLPDRVALSRGRDITLSPPQQGGPLNYFVYPYAEVDGVAHPVEFSATYTHQQ